MERQVNETKMENATRANQYEARLSVWLCIWFTDKVFDEMLHRNRCSCDLGENSFQIPSNIGMMQNSFQTLHHFNGFLGNLPMFHVPHPSHEFLAQSSSLSYNSTSDDAEEQQKSIIDERKQRRMISNRESARRSRMRKQKHLDELWSQVLRLRTENHELIDKLNHVSDSHEKVLLENARLKEEASDLRQMLSDLQIGSPYNPCLSNLEDIPCNTAHLRAESSSCQSIANSIDNLLH